MWFYVSVGGDATNKLSLPCCACRLSIYVLCQSRDISVLCCLCFLSSVFAL